MKKVTLIICLWLSGGLLFAQNNPDQVLALQFYQNGDYKKALELYEKLFSDSKNKLQYYDSYFTSLLKVQDFAAAEKLVKKMMSSYKSNFTFMVDYGRILSEKGQTDKANDWYLELIKGLPKDEFAIRDLSITFYRAEAYDYSIKTLLAGRKLLNDETAFSFDLLALYRYQKNKGLLVDEYVNILSRSPEPTILNQAKSALSSVLEKAEDFDILRSALLRKLQKAPQNMALTELLAWQYIQQKEFDMALRQVIALDKRLKEDGERVFELASLLLSNKAYPQAIDALEYIVSKGPNNANYIPAKMQVLYAKNQQLINGKLVRSELESLEKDYQSLLSEFGRTRNTVFAMRQLALLQAFHLNKARSAESMLEEVLRIPGIQQTVIGQTKLELGDVYILTGEIWEAALIYGQAEKDFANEPIGQEAKFRNAKLSYYRGDFIWAKAQLDVLKSSTSQLIANDALNLSLLIAENIQSEADSNALKKYAYADFMIFTSQYEKALKVLDSIDVLYPQNSLTDDILMGRAKIFIRQNNAVGAVDQLNKIVAHHANDLWADDALFTLADLYEKDLNDTQKAMQCYQKIITDYPGSLFVTEARKRFRELRGDNLG